MTSTSKVIDYGSYGLVLSPALENDPPYENDPLGQITKVFYHKKDYDTILKKNRRLAAIIGNMNDGYRFKTYERNWYGSNFSPNVYNILSQQLSINGDESQNYSSTQFYPIRMVNLGKSLALFRSTELARCEVHHIITAIKKIYDVLATLSAHDTLHGDIHGGNLLIYMTGTFCDISLIDYDKFETYKEMKKAYDTGRNYLYGPPESYYLIHPEHRPSLSTNHAEKKEEEEEELSSLDIYFIQFYSNKYIQMVYPNIQVMKDQIREAILAHGEKPFPFSHMDSFLVSSLFLGLLYHTYPFLYGKGDTSLSPQEEKAIRDTKEVLEQGFSFSVTTRLGPDEIVQHLQQILDRMKGQNTPSASRMPSASLMPAPSCSKNKNKSNCKIMGGTRKKRTRQGKKMKRTRGRRRQS